MAKTSKAKIGGPFLGAAFFCESVMEDQDKVISAIRIADSMNMWLSPDAPQDAPSESQPIRIIQHFIVMFRSGDAPGKHELKLVMHTPSGKKSEVFKKVIELTKEPNGGFQLKGQAGFEIHSTGVYWMDVSLDGKLYTRMPYRININRLARPKAKKQKSSA